MAAVQVRGVVKAFGRGEQQVVALRNVDWDVTAGEMMLLAGPSGCGKTTLLSLIAGILNCDEGSVSIFDQELTRMSDARKTRFRREMIGFVFQQYNLLPALTAAENAAIPLTIAGWPKSKAVAKAKETLASLGLGNRLKSRPSQLSGGQQQRVAIARALVHEPKLLVADEPTAALDVDTGRNVMELLKQAAVKPDRAVIIVTHDHRVFHYGDQIAHMDNGQIVRTEIPTQAPKEATRS